MGDRSGSREPKGASLKKSRKNPGASAAKQKKISLKALGVSSGPIASLPPPLPLYGDNHYFDCGVALLSRQFDRDRDRVLQRAHADGHCMGMLVWFSDIEKQSSISDICKTNSGYCYYATGIHPDNIDRTNKKSHDEWLEKVEEMGKKAECLALLSGLNLSREVGTHFSQESLLTSSLQLTKKLQLPLILHLADGKSVERSIEMLYGESSGKDDDDLSGFTASMIIHDVITCTGAEPNFKTLLVEHAQSPTHPLYFIVSGAGITDPDDVIRSKAREFLHDLPNESLLVATDSPWRTPQNLPDAYLRTLRNEPSNIESIVQAMAETKGVDLPTMARILKENTLRVFGMESIRLHAAMPAVQEGNDEEEDEEEEEVEDHPKATAKHVEEVSKGMKDLKVSGGGEKNKKKEEKKEEKKKDKKNNNKKLHQDSDDDDNDEPIKPIHDDHEETEKNNKKKNKKEKEKETTTTDVTSSTASAHQYRCVKCRNFVFSAKDITTHSLGASKTVFKVGEEGLCASFHFIPAADGREIHKRLGIQIRGGNVECSQCGMKIGKYSPGEAICPCGAVVTGPVAKINATKIDFHDQTLDAKELAERSKLEIEDAQRQDELDDAEYEAKMQQSAGRVKKAKKHKSENRGNFSNFRNKSFIPNASKTGKKESNAGGGGVEENEEGGGEEEDEEEVESDN